MKRNKGITLIALIITILVMLILAGVAITMAVGERGVITRGETANATMEQKNIEETIQTSYYYDKDNAGKLDYDETKTAIEQNLISAGYTNIGVTETGEEESKILTVTATGKTGTYSYEINQKGKVEKNDDNDGPVPPSEEKGIKINVTEKTMKVNDEFELEVTPIGNVDLNNITFNSLDEDVAKVDANGKVTAVSEGTTTITVQSGVYSQTCTVTVKSISIEEVSFYGIYNFLSGGTLEIKEQNADGELVATVSWDGDTANGTYTYDASAKTGSITVEDFEWELTFEQKDILDENGDLINICLIIEGSDGEHFDVAGKNGLGITPLTGKTYRNESGYSMTFDIMNYGDLQVGVYYDHKGDIHVGYCVIDGILYFSMSVERIDSNYETITIYHSKNGDVIYTLDK